MGNGKEKLQQPRHVRESYTQKECKKGVIATVTDTVGSWTQRLRRGGQKLRNEVPCRKKIEKVTLISFRQFDNAGAPPYCIAPDSLPATANVGRELSLLDGLNSDKIVDIQPRSQGVVTTQPSALQYFKKNANETRDSSTQKKDVPDIAQNRQPENEMRREGPCYQKRRKERFDESLKFWQELTGKTGEELKVLPDLERRFEEWKLEDMKCQENKKAIEKNLLEDLAKKNVEADLCENVKSMEIEKKVSDPLEIHRQSINHPLSDVGERRNAEIDRDVLEGAIIPQEKDNADVIADIQIPDFVDEDFEESVEIAQDCMPSHNIEEQLQSSYDVISQSHHRDEIDLTDDLPSYEEAIGIDQNEDRANAISPSSENSGSQANEPLTAQNCKSKTAPKTVFSYEQDEGWNCNTVPQMEPLTSVPVSESSDSEIDDGFCTDESTRNARDSSKSASSASSTDTSDSDFVSQNARKNRKYRRRRNKPYQRPSKPLQSRAEESWSDSESERSSSTRSNVSGQYAGYYSDPGTTSNRHAVPNGRNIFRYKTTAHDRLKCARQRRCRESWDKKRAHEKALRCNTGLIYVLLQHFMPILDETKKQMEDDRKKYTENLEKICDCLLRRSSGFEVKGNLIAEHVNSNGKSRIRKKQCRSTISN